MQTAMVGCYEGRLAVEASSVNAKKPLSCRVDFRRTPNATLPPRGGGVALGVRRHRVVVYSCVNSGHPVPKFIVSNLLFVQAPL